MEITKSIVSQRDRALLTGDYNNYHAQASRRIHAIRRRLGEATPRGRKFTAKEAVTAEQVGKNTEYAQLLLASSERAWASAMAMKSAQSPETTRKPMPGSTKRQIISRLKKAMAYADNLVNVLKAEQVTYATTRDLLEAKAYLSFLRGTMQFEKLRWQSCLHEFSLTRLVYTTLESQTKADTFKDLLSSTIDPSIRYAAYQLKLPRTTPLPHIAIHYFPPSENEVRKEIESIDSHAFSTETETSSIKGTSAADLPATISWRTRTVKIEDAAIAEALGSVRTLEKDLSIKITRVMTSAEMAAAYDSVISAQQDAVDATNTAISELTTEGIDQGDPRMQALQVTRTAVNYALIEWRVGRNRILCGPSDGMLFDESTQPTTQKSKKSKKHPTSAKPSKAESKGRKLGRLRERLALYDAILQSIDSVRDLPGVVGDSSFVAELEGKTQYFRALRSLTIGRSHVILDNLLNALALFARAADLASTAAAATTPSDATAKAIKLSLPSPVLSTFTTYLATLVTRYRALCTLHQLIAAEQSATAVLVRPPLVERLDEFDDAVDLKNLVEWPPRLRGVPVKPLFFDLAWNYIDYPGRIPAGGEGVNGVVGAGAGKGFENAEGQGEEKKETRRGWFGFGR